jgi:hypothetical protein
LLFFKGVLIAFWCRCCKRSAQFYWDNIMTKLWHFISLFVLFNSDFTLSASYFSEEDFDFQDEEDDDEDEDGDSALELTIEYKSA